MALSQAGVRRGQQQQDDYAATCIEAWNLMGGEVNYAALPVICAMLGVDDAERLVRGLVQIREWKAQENG